MKLFNQANRTEYVESDKAMPIIARVGTGGQRQRCYLLYQGTVGSLCQDDYKGPNRQYADQDKLIIEVCEVITK